MISDIKLKLILFTHTNLGVACIKQLINTKNEILMVFTHPTEADENEKIWYDSVKDECVKNRLPVEERTKLTEEDVEKIQELKPDLIFSINWRRIIPSSIFKIPRYGSLNIHAGLLPKYGGFSPINWAIINGEKEIGVTVHHMEEVVDGGDIISQNKIEVDINDTAKTVFDRVLELYPEMVLEALNFVESEKEPIKQNKSERFWVTRRFPKDGKIDWSQDRMKIYNLIRALVDPFPNAFCYFNNKKIYIKKAKLLDEDFRGTPGRICAIREEGIIVTCGTNFEENQGLLITEIATDEKIFKPNEFFLKLWEDLE